MGFVDGRAQFRQLELAKPRVSSIGIDETLIRHVVSESFVNCIDETSPSSLISDPPVEVAHLACEMGNLAGNVC